ncbi:MAG: LysR family transcriptional regulator [Ruminococcaceae bacterium]|nr:LysR family transcriptional regulator [Oscillospiraceae bacterium]
MELPQKYVYAVWEYKSFSKAAKALFVSQPSLSATVAKLENELGFKIFDRSTHPISLTAKGTVYMNFLRETSELEKILAHQLKATDDMNSGSLTIGCRMSSGYSIFPIVCGEFSRKYPNINVIVDNDSSEEKLKMQTIDLLLSFAPQITECAAIPLFQERLFIAIHKNHPQAREIAAFAVPYQAIVSQSISAEQEITDMSVFSDVPFIVTGMGTDSDRRLAMMVKNHKTSSCIVINTKNFDIRYRLMKEGLGAVLVSDVFLSNYPQDSENIYYFALQNPHAYRTLYIQHLKSMGDNKILSKFIEAMLTICRDKAAILQRKNFFFA